MARSARAVAIADREASERRRTILRAAIEVFARKGFHGCRIADVAREAKVAYGLVYHYFKNKDELLESVFEVTWKNFIGRIRQAVEASAPLEQKVRDIVAQGATPVEVINMIVPLCAELNRWLPEHVLEMDAGVAIFRTKTRFGGAPIVISRRSPSP